MLLSISNLRTWTSGLQDFAEPATPGLKIGSNGDAYARGLMHDVGWSHAFPHPARAHPQ